MNKDAIDSLAQLIAGEAMEHEFAMAAVQVAATEGKQKPQQLFWTGAYTGAVRMIKPVVPEFDKMSELYSAAMPLLDQALEQIMIDAPASGAADTILETRNLLTNYASEQWRRFWAAHKKRFGEIVGLKEEYLDGEDPDYTAMVYGLHAYFEQTNDATHPIVVWAFYRNTDKVAHIGRISYWVENIPKNEWRTALARYNELPDHQAVALLREYVTAMRSQWAGVKKEITEFVGDRRVPNFFIGCEIAQMWDERYPVKGD